MPKRKTRWQAVRTIGVDSFEVKAKFGSLWYTIAETHCVPGIGDAMENAQHIANLLNDTSHLPRKARRTR